MAKRAMTQQEIKRAKAQAVDAEELTVYNNSTRMIPIQSRTPGSDFYVGEQTIRIKPGQTYSNVKAMFNMDQLRNLRVKQELQFTE